MTYEELKAEAKRQGYKLVKDNPLPKKLPCVCGCKRRSTWNVPNGLYLECMSCGLQGDIGHTTKEAIENWNNMVLEEEKAARSLDDWDGYVEYE